MIFWCEVRNFQAACAAFFIGIMLTAAKASVNSPVCLRPLTLGGRQKISGAVYGWNDLTALQGFSENLNMIKNSILGGNKKLVKKRRKGDIV